MDLEQLFTRTFLIVQVFRPMDESFEDKKNHYIAFNRTAQRIHKRMTQQNWVPFGYDRSLKKSIEDQFKYHILNPNSNDLLDKKTILSRIKKAFDDPRQGFISLFLVGHAVKMHNPQSRNEYHFLINPEVCQTVKLRQILNLWEPRVYKHLLICIYACDTLVIENIMKQYQLSSSIAIISSVNENGEFSHYTESDNHLDIVLFGAKVSQEIRARIYQCNPKKIHFGDSQEDWVIMCSQGFEKWKQRQNSEQLIFSQQKLIRKYTHSNSSKQSSKMYGEWCFSPNKKTIINGRGFLSADWIYFEGIFKNQKFEKGRLYSRLTQETTYGYISPYSELDFIGLCCIVGDNGSVTLKWFENYPVVHQDFFDIISEISYSKTSPYQPIEHILSINEKSSNFCIKIFKKDNNPGIINHEIMVEDRKLQNLYFKSKDYIYQQQKNYEYNHQNYRKQFQQVVVEYVEQCYDFMRPIVKMGIWARKNGQKVQDHDFGEFFKEFNIFGPLNKYADEIVTPRGKVYQLVVECYYLKITPRQKQNKQPVTMSYYLAVNEKEVISQKS